MASRFIIAFLLAITSIAQAQEIKPVTFKIKNAGINVKGSFSSIKVNASFDPGDLGASTFQATIEVSSLNTGIAGRDKHLKKAKYFDLEHYPEISFKSTGVSKTEAGYLAKGILKIKATERSIEIPFTLREENNQRILEGYFEVNRRDYGIGKGSLIMGNLVKINVYYILPK